MAAEPIQATASSQRLPQSAQLVLAFLLGGIAVIIAGRFLPLFNRPSPTQLVATGVDLNRADKAELMQLPRISDKRAEAIIAERNRRGGFERADDLRKVDGIGPKTQRDLNPHVRLAGGEQWLKTDSDEPPMRWPRKEAPTSIVDVNRADLLELQTLPAIGPVMAGRILAEREKGPFRTVEDLRRVTGLGPKTLEKIRPFVKVSD